MRKNTFNPVLALTTTMALVAGSQMVYAQQAAQDVEEVTVTGFRSTVVNAVDAKRNADTIADVVDAGALSSLPDQSIADALGRIPGVTTVRDSGQSSQLNIRGMNGDFIQTTLNGREQASTSGYTESTRWMAFDQYPAELITQAAVYKSPKASHIEGGVAGLVDLKTVNPLDAKQDHNFNVSARASYNDSAADVGADEMGSRFSASYQGKFMDDMLGVAVGYSHLDQPNSFVGARAGADSFVGYKSDVDVNNDGSNDSRARAFQWQAGTGSDKRDGYLATIVFQPADNFKAQFDYFKSVFDRSDSRHGITVSALDNTNAYDLTDTTVANGLVTGGTVTITDPATTYDSSPWFEARTEDQSTKADTDSYGLNLEWNIDENNTVTVDIASSKGTKTRKDRLVSMHAYDLTTDTDGNLTAWEEQSGQSFTYMGNGDGMPTVSFDGIDFTDLTHMRLSRYEEYPHLYTDKVDSFKVDYKLELDTNFITSIEAGVRISDRKFNSKRGAFLYGARDGQFGDLDSSYCADNMTGAEGDSTFVACMPQSLDGFVSVESLPGVPDHLVVTDIDGLATSIFGAGNYVGKQVFSRDWTFVESGLLEEKVNSYYLMANIGTELGSVGVTGNVGVRIVQTDVKASGVQNVGAGNGITITDDLGFTSDAFDYVKYGPEYTDTLPEINLNFALSDSDTVRFAAAKVMGRPPVGQLKGGAGSWNSTNNNGDIEYNVWTKGSPYLDPFRATQFDLSYEHYFDEGDAITAAIFWKDIQSLIEQQSTNPGAEGFAALGIDIPDGQVAGVFQTYVNNKNGGYIRGAEVAITDTFTELPGIFSGLGVTASYSYTESETKIAGGSLYGKTLPLQGLSRNVWSVTGFWDIGSFSSHVNVRYRDPYISNLLVPGGTTPALYKSYTTVDAQASYAFDNGMDVVFSINNLTDEPNIASYGEDAALGEYKEYGRQYTLGVNYKF